MKNKLKLLGALVLASVALLTIPARAGYVGSVDFGITNATISANSTNTALGTGVVSVDQQDFVTLEYTSGTTATNAANVVIPIYRVDPNGLMETTPFITWTLPQYIGTPGTTTTNTTTQFTNLTRDVLGAIPSLTCTNIGNTSTNGVLVSPALKVLKKRLQAPN